MRLDRLRRAAAHFGTVPAGLLPILPYAASTLPFLLLFRLTCYYYRKAYYRSFWLSPPACAVAEPHRRYTGETRFPLIVPEPAPLLLLRRRAHLADQHLRRVPRVRTADGGFGFGLGNIILLVNVVLLWAYTLSCHSCRHIIGGRLKHFSRHPVRYRAWTFVSRLNTRHMQLAWITLATLALTDFYIMAVSAGWISDLRFWGELAMTGHGSA